MGKVINAASDRHRMQMQDLCDFVGADEIEYRNLGNGEDYTMRKDGKTLTLKVRGNKVDGGFLAIDTEHLRQVMPPITMR